MTRWRCWVCATVLVTAACQPETVPNTTVAVSPPSTTTTSIAASTTSPTVPAPFDICSRGVVWEAGSTYVADCFARRLTFQPEEEGWVSGGASDGHLLIRWTDPDDRELEARIAFIIYAGNQPVSGLLDRILAVGGIGMIGAPNAVEVAGWSGLSAELEGGPEQNTPRDPPCTIGDAVWFSPTKFGHGFFEVDRNRVVGVGACQVVQAWAIDADGLAVTILAGTEDPADHSIAVEAAERLFASMTFGPTP